jgi:hypothetical protein
VSSTLLLESIILGFDIPEYNNIHLSDHLHNTRVGTLIVATIYLRA